MTKLPKLPEGLLELGFVECGLTEMPEIPSTVNRCYFVKNNWTYPIDIKYYKLFDHSLHEIYTEEQLKRFGKYEFQKEFIEKFPLRLKELYNYGVDPKIKEEYDYLFNFDQYLD